MGTILSGGTFDITRWGADTLPASQNHRAGAVDGSRSPRPGRQPALPRYRAGDICHGKTGPAPISRFEQIAYTAAGISAQRVKLLGVLLSSASPTLCGGRPVLRPIWAAEALHRAYSIVRLVARLERRTPTYDKQPGRLHFEDRLGDELASIFDSLAIDRAEELRPCSTSLRDVARNLIELFGPAVGDIIFASSVDRLALPAFQHRALILAASELIMNTLLHAFNGRSAGRVTLELALLNQGMARLTVTDDGNYPSGAPPHCPARCSVINYLADLLQSEPVYRSGIGDGMIAEIDIPIQEQWPASIDDTRCKSGLPQSWGCKRQEGILAPFFGREWTRGLDFEVGEDRRRSRG
jgi:two-component sensor histidine kinase